MKTLYLARHANAELSLTHDDHARLLSDKGRCDAQLLGKRLQQQDLNVDLIITSSAQRARTSAKLLAQALHYADEKIIQQDSLYNASYEALLETILQLDSTQQMIMLMGHNPGMSQLASYLTDEMVSLPTCAVYGMQMQVDNWSEVGKSCAKELFLVYPGST